MKLSTRNALIVAAVAIVSTTGSYWYWSPVFSVHSMKAAAERRDADAFNDYVDYPRVRESLKGQLASFMARQMAAAGATGSQWEQAGAALGSALGLALVDGLVDALVRPEAVMRAMQEARLSDERPADGPDAGKPGPSQVVWTYERKSLNKLIAHAAEREGGAQANMSLVFERSGFSTWRLTEVRMPHLGQ